MGFSQPDSEVKKRQWCDGMLLIQCVCVVYESHIVVLRREKKYPDALHVGASVKQVYRLVQVILTPQRNGHLQKYKWSNKENPNKHTLQLKMSTEEFKNA